MRFKIPSLSLSLNFKPPSLQLCNHMCCNRKNGGWGVLCVQSVLLKLQLRQLPWWLFVWLLLGPCRLRVCGLWSRCCHHMGMVMSFLVLATAASSMVNTWMISSSPVGTWAFISSLSPNFQIIIILLFSSPITAACHQKSLRSLELHTVPAWSALLWSCRY